MPTKSLILRKRRLRFGKNHDTATQSSPFLALPCELRMLIYDFVYCEFSKPDTHWCNTHPFYALLFVNRAMRLEISEVLYTKPSFKFSSPHRCLFFLKWTSAQIRLLRGLRIAVPTHDTYSLEPIFELLVKLQVPLEGLAFDFMNINSAAEPPPEERMLPADVASEALKQARDRSDDLRRLFDVDLDPTQEFCPSSTETSVDRAQFSTNSSLGHLTTLRYLETDDYPVGNWAAEFELALLRLDARMFETAAKEGLRMEHRKPIHIFRTFRVLDLRRRKWPFRYRWYVKGDLWLARQFSIEGTVMLGEDQQPRMGVRDVNEFTLCPLERKRHKVLSLLGLKTSKVSSSKEDEVRQVWLRLDLTT